jgi:hypothetical protein
VDDLATVTQLLMNDPQLKLRFLGPQSIFSHHPTLEPKMTLTLVGLCERRLCPSLSPHLLTLGP